MGHATRSRIGKARVRHAAQAAAISEYARALVPAGTDDCATPGEFITQARRLRVLALDLLTSAVILERERGSTWEQIASALGLWQVGEDGDFIRDSGKLIPDPRSAQDRYVDAMARWHEGDLNPGIPEELAVIAPMLDEPSAEQLDKWYRRHEEAEGRPTRDKHPLGGHL